MIVTFLLGDDRPPFRSLWEGELPAVPLPGEPIAFNDRIYRVVERSWRFGTVKERGEMVTQLAVGVLLTQISGAPHVTIAPGTGTAN